MLRPFSRQFSDGAIALSATNSALTKFEDTLRDLGKSSSLDYFSEVKRISGLPRYVPWSGKPIGSS
jgi:hypothetical protein